MARIFDTENLSVFPEREVPKPTLRGSLQRNTGDLKKDFEQTFSALFGEKD